MRLVTTTLITFLTIFPFFAQDVSIVTTGQGKTMDEAKLNALRTGIEQAFGAFISSRTEIINDELKNDEIVTITNGNIKEFQILEQWTDNQDHFVIIKSLVSISTLSEYLREKGHTEVTFNGSNFAFNLKLQKFNEQSEIIALKNILNAFLNQATKVIDKNLTISDPQFITNDVYKIRISVEFSGNQAQDIFYSKLIESLKSISMTKEEILSYNKISKNIYQIFPVYRIYKDDIPNSVLEDPLTFRSEESLILFRSFLFCVNFNLINSVIIKNDISDIFIAKSINVESSDQYYQNDDSLMLYTICERCTENNVWRNSGYLPFSFGKGEKYFVDQTMNIWSVLSFRGRSNYGAWTNDFPVVNFSKLYFDMSTENQLEFVFNILKSGQTLYHHEVNAFVRNSQNDYKLNLQIDVPMTVDQLSQVSNFVLE